MKRLVSIAMALSLTILLVSIAMAQAQLDFHLSDSSDGSAITQFPSGVGDVYAIYNCIDEIKGQEMVIRVKGDLGIILFEQALTCTGNETKSVATMTSEGYFPDGRYLTNLYQDEFPSATIIWDVGEPVAKPTATPTATPSRVARVTNQVMDFAVPAAAILLIVLVAWAIYRVLAAR